MTYEKCEECNTEKELVYKIQSIEILDKTILMNVPFLKCQNCNTFTTTPETYAEMRKKMREVIMEKK